LSKLEERLAAALETQLGSWRATLREGAERVGWKIGLGIPEVEALMGAEPVIGHLTSATKLESGATWSARDAAVLRAETEVAVEVGPGEAVAGLGTALELVDLARPPHGFEGIVAANVFHRAFVLGPSRPVAPGERPEATLSVNGRLRASGRASADFAATVRSVARLLALVGERLEPGDRIIAGSLTHVPVGPGDEVVAEIDGLGAVRVAIEP
jgi:2-keto-4-pentenoate hydratase